MIIKIFTEDYNAVNFEHLNETQMIKVLNLVNELTLDESEDDF